METSECEIPSPGDQESYEDLRDAMQSQTYWIRFFMRPCCPPPGEDTARALVERLKGEIDERSDMSVEQRADLKSIIDGRLEWYLSLSVRHMA